MDESKGALRRTVLGCLVLLVALLGCGLVTGFVLESTCQSGLSRRLPIYPEAEVTVERHNLLRPFGMGETYVVLYSPDDPAVVREWYARTTAPVIREAALGDDVALRLTRSQWDVRRSERGTGSEIRLLGTCAQ